jgi:hypothetical protein
MKKQVIFTATGFLLAVLSFSSCKKSTSSGPDVSASIKGKTWTGEQNYTGKSVEPISIEFAEGGSLSYHEVKGDFDGTWKLDGTKLTINVDGSLAFKADVSTDDRLTGIVNSDVNGRTLNNANLNIGDDKPLDGTAWQATGVGFKFKAGNLVDLIFGNNLASPPTYPNMTYVRKGKSIRFFALPTYKWFMTVNSSTSMKGANLAPGDPFVYAFLSIKQ